VIRYTSVILIGYTKRNKNICKFLHYKGGNQIQKNYSKWHHTKQITYADRPRICRCGNCFVQSFWGKIKINCDKLEVQPKMLVSALKNEESELNSQMKWWSVWPRHGMLYGLKKFKKKSVIPEKRKKKWLSVKLHKSKSYYKNFKVWKLNWNRNKCKVK